MYLDAHVVMTHADLQNDVIHKLYTLQVDGRVYISGREGLSLATWAKF